MTSLTECSMFLDVLLLLRLPVLQLPLRGGGRVGAGGVVLRGGEGGVELAWHDTLRTTLAALGFAPFTSDPSLFLRTDTLLPPFYILVYVDDLVFATADTAGLAHVKSELQKRHTCTDLGELRSYLGLQITRDRARRTITLTQSHMVQQVLQRFDFTYSSPQATPLSTHHSLSALPSDESVEQSGPYPELVGCLMYLMTCTRPDLAYPLSILARYVAPGRHRPEHMAAVKRVLRYLCSTSGLGLVLGGRSPVVLTGHADASWVDDLATQRSSQGYTFSLGSGSVSWRSTRSSSVLSSSCEAEIYAGAMVAQELRWLTYLLTDLGEPPSSPPVLYVDNKAMLALCREHRLEHRTKHIALRYFLARELQQRGQLRLAYVASQANTADIFTKALQPCVHQRFCTMLDGRDGRDGRDATDGRDETGRTRRDGRMGRTVCPSLPHAAPHMLPFAPLVVPSALHCTRRSSYPTCGPCAAPRIALSVPFAMPFAPPLPVHRALPCLERSRCPALRVLPTPPIRAASRAPPPLLACRPCPVRRWRLAPPMLARHCCPVCRRCPVRHCCMRSHCLTPCAVPAPCAAAAWRHRYPRTTATAAASAAAGAAATPSVVAAITTAAIAATATVAAAASGVAATAAAARTAATAATAAAAAPAAAAATTASAAAAAAATAAAAAATAAAAASAAAAAAAAATAVIAAVAVATVAVATATDATTTSTAAPTAATIAAAAAATATTAAADLAPPLLPPVHCTAAADACALYCCHYRPFTAATAHVLLPPKHHCVPRRHPLN
ncbi:unnamed protein product [Closterium sp. NIES-54]